MTGTWIRASLFALMLADPLGAETIDVSSMLAEAGVAPESSTIMIMRLSDGLRWISNPPRAHQRFSPASTSKIPHTLIALEKGLADSETIFSWDGVPRSNPRWNQNQTLKSAFKHSAIWVYRQITQSAGSDALSTELARLAYGNADVGKAEQVTSYWLDGTLRISVVEQVDFLSRLALGQLDLSSSTYAAAHDIMEFDRGDHWVLYAKSGWRVREKAADIGWFVGWLECPHDAYVFALNMDMSDSRFLTARTTLAYAVMNEIGAFDCR